MRIKQWDKYVEKGLEKIKPKTALELIEEYWNNRREEIYEEVEATIAENMLAVKMEVFEAYLKEKARIKK
jgi:5'-3' exonuclease